MDNYLGGKNHNKKRPTNEEKRLKPQLIVLYSFTTTLK